MGSVSYSVVLEKRLEFLVLVIFLIRNAILIPDSIFMRHRDLVLTFALVQFNLITMQSCIILLGEKGIYVQVMYFFSFFLCFVVICFDTYI